MLVDAHGLAAQLPAAIASDESRREHLERLLSSFIMEPLELERVRSWRGATVPVVNCWAALEDLARDPFVTHGRADHLRAHGVRQAGDLAVQDRPAPVVSTSGRSAVPGFQRRGMSRRVLRLLERHGQRPFCIVIAAALPQVAGWACAASPTIAARPAEWARLRVTP